MLHPVPPADGRGPDFYTIGVQLPMAKNDAFTAGVRPGGLTDSTEIRLLLCYLIKCASPLSRQNLENALLDEALVNYFEIGACLDDLIRQGLAVEENGSYIITAKGARVAAELAYDLPRSVRERAMNAVLKAQVWERKSAEYHTQISANTDGTYRVNCTVNAISNDVFRLQLAMPDKETAELVQKQFTLRGHEVYRLLIEELTKTDDLL